MPRPFEIIEAIDRAAAKGQGESRKTILEAFAELRRAISAGKLAEAVAVKNVGPVMDLDAWRVFSEISSKLFVPDGPVRQAIDDAIRRGLREAPIKDLVFDTAPLDRRALQYLERDGAKLVRDITRSTRTGMRKLLRQSFKRGSLGDGARAILARKDFGLTLKQTDGFNKWVAKLLEDVGNPLADRFGQSPKQVQQTIDREFKRRLRNRARLIVRTEHYNAGNDARLQLWNEAAASGALDTEEFVLQWITRGFNVCPRCIALALKVTEIGGGIFESDVVVSGQFAGQIIKIERPTVHPGCYCALRVARRRDVLLRAA